MDDVQNKTASGTSHRSRLFYFNGGFFTQSRVRRILDLAGFDLTLGKPGADDLVAVWGKSPTSGRGEAVSGATGSPLLYVEDAFLRSIKPGRSGEPPLGLTIDRLRPYFDSAGPSDLELLLKETPFDDAALLTRARDAMARMRALHLSKYNDFDLTLPAPEPGYVLVIDQTRDDAAIEHGNASVAHFREMLVYAQQDFPGARIIIKSHPETTDGHRSGHFGPEHLTDRMTLLSDPISPYELMDGALAVYTVSSTLGFEAILAGHKPNVFGQPFYAGWGLTEDHQPIDRRQRRLTRAQLFAGVMMLYPKWYDPYHDRLCELEEVLDTLEAMTRARRQDRQGYSAVGMSAWKTAHLSRFFGDVAFVSTEQEALRSGKPILSWAGKTSELMPRQCTAPLYRVEDGFLRSRGLGAELIPPLSLVTDQTGIYYDPRAASDLELLIKGSTELPQDALDRAERLRREVIKAGLSKYNLEAPAVEFDAGGRDVILVVGQVEDDASVTTGAPEMPSNDMLIEAVRRDFPESFLVYKPHPDVEAGLRAGGLSSAVDFVANRADPIAMLGRCDRVATLTSLLGFEALLREIPVTCYGVPFYAGWGLTEDRCPTPPRRDAQPTLAQLVHACLIGYPRYFDPKTGQPCPPEVVVHRLATADIPKPGTGNRVLAKLQHRLRALAPLWRR